MCLVFLFLKSVWMVALGRTYLSGVLLILSCCYVVSLFGLLPWTIVIDKVGAWRRVTCDDDGLSATGLGCGVEVGV